MSFAGWLGVTALRHKSEPHIDLYQVKKIIKKRSSHVQRRALDAGGGGAPHRQSHWRNPRPTTKPVLGRELQTCAVSNPHVGLWVEGKQYQYFHVQYTNSGDSFGILNSQRLTGPPLHAKVANPIVSTKNVHVYIGFFPHSSDNPAPHLRQPSTREGELVSQRFVAPGDTVPCHGSCLPAADRGRESQAGRKSVCKAFWIRGRRKWGDEEREGVLIWAGVVLTCTTGVCCCIKGDSAGGPPPTRRRVLCSSRGLPESLPQGIIGPAPGLVLTRGVL